MINNIIPTDDIGLTGLGVNCVINCSIIGLSKRDIFIQSENIRSLLIPWRNSEHLTLLASAISKSDTLICKHVISNPLWLATHKYSKDEKIQLSLILNGKDSVFKCGHVQGD